MVVVSRLRQRKAVYQAGLDHTYHRLVNLGWPPSRAVLTMHLAAIVSGCLAFVALPLPPLWANAIFAVVLLIGIFILFRLEEKEPRLMQSAPLVSILIVYWNNAEYLPRCLDCLSAQTFRDFETIVIDNGSVDGGTEGLEQKILRD